MSILISNILYLYDIGMYFVPSCLPAFAVCLFCIHYLYSSVDQKDNVSIIMVMCVEKGKDVVTFVSFFIFVLCVHCVHV